ncbi:FAD-dependent oxidoreductase [Alkaliphilus sp. B6464]|uniref:FAD-dependent oxidoreductase n=1 Tax=Alkaliphilus sp. B6464 TaxID=2731219 RepID=UPI001BACC64E|nr:FAD-dependent oxidoreductase [Alkaliphilus sp. B6464]QUH19549.1 FAD-dependent oxidoreductase [Alkaliphilus sp. B6464]
MEQYYSPDKGFTKEPESYWIASTGTTDYPALQEDITVDVAIVGGGITGITSGYLLKKEGLTVAIIDADHIANGTTGHTTAKITSQHDLIYDKMIKQIGIEKAKQYAESNEQAIKFIAQIVEEKNIDCDFSWQNAYVYTQSDGYVEQIKNEVKAAQELGIKASYVEDLPLPFPIKAAVQFEGQAKFHPRKYLLSLAEDIAGDGSYIFENTKAVGIEEGEKCSVVAENGKKITASKIIIASHYPFSNIRGLYVARIYQERAYIVAIKAKSKFPDGMYINAERPARSLRSHPFGDDQELVLVVGENHKTGHGNDINTHYENLIDFANENFEVEEVLYRWSAQDCMTMDDIPFIGSINSAHPNIYIATGFKKWGMTSSTVSAMILKDLIVNGESPWAEVYDPSRFINAGSIWTFIKENLDVAVNLIWGKLSPGSINPDIEKGQGKVIDIDGQKVGAYRDEEGKLYFVNTTCTHMGCEVKWNDAERTWDCPCHGSRFSPIGDVIEGPAFGPLEKIEVD